MKLLFPMFLIFLSSCNSSKGKSSSSAAAAPQSEPAVVNGTDPLAQYAWHLNNTGQTTFSTSAGVAGEDLSIQDVHDLGINGDGVVIAISDTGADVTHPDLKDTQVTSLHRNYSSNTSSTWAAGGNPYPIEGEAHGTAVSGLAAASAGNGVGSKGVAPGATFGAFLFVGDFQNNAASYEAKTIDQISGPFDIFNYSYGYSGCEFTPVSSTIISAYLDGVTNLRAGKGAVYVKAAGNDYIGYNSDCYSGDTSKYLGNTNTNEDQNTPYVILAAATNAKGKISSYSTPGSGLWVSSAGGEFGTSSPAMLTTDIQTCSKGMSVSTSGVTSFNTGKTPNGSCNYTSIMNGTSSSSPVLAGVVALMLDANSSLTWRDVKHILAETADKINYSTSALNHPGGTSLNLSGYTYDYNYVLNAAGKKFSNTYGFGRVNALAAVQMAQTYVSALGTYHETAYQSSGTLNSSIPDNSSTGVTNVINVASSYTIESVQIKLTTDHTYLGDLGVELISPSGTHSRLLLINSNIKQSALTDFTLLSNAFYGENSSGNWTIKLVDASAGDSGKLVSWKIRVSGH